MALAHLARIAAALVAAAGLTATGAAQPQSQPLAEARTEAPQITATDAMRPRAASEAYLETERRQPPAPRSSLTQASDDRIVRPAGNAPTSQITNRTQSGAGIAQLSQAELDATLAQLSAVERRVLLQAIEGTDICDNPPNVPAILALCQNRIENHSQDFTEVAERPLSAEERLLSSGLESTAVPSVSQVVERLSRGNAATDDFSNQAIASIALGLPTQPRDEEKPEDPALSQETQGLINALINQLGGGKP